VVAGLRLAVVVVSMQVVSNSVAQAAAGIEAVTSIRAAADIEEAVRPLDMARFVTQAGYQVARSLKLVLQVTAGHQVLADLQAEHYLLQ